MLNKIDQVIKPENQNRVGLAFVSTVLGLLMTLQFRATLVVQQESLPLQRIEGAVRPPDRDGTGTGLFKGRPS